MFTINLPANWETSHFIWNLQTALSRVSKEAHIEKIPVVTWKLLPKIIINLLNYKIFISYLNTCEAVRNNSVLLCSCENSKIKASDHGKILARHLSFVANNKMRSTISKDQSFKISQ